MILNTNTSSNENASAPAPGTNEDTTMLTAAKLASEVASGVASEVAWEAASEEASEVAWEAAADAAKKASDAAEAADSINDLKKKYPSDCYSLLAISGQDENSFILFAFGLIPFIFQITFLALFFLAFALNEDGEADNPTESFWEFIPANANRFVRTAQLVALVAYVFYPESSVQDIATAIETFPRTRNCKTKMNVVSCVLRFIQGVTAALVTLLLIAQTETVVDILLNFTAIGFVSELDNRAFEFAKSGEFGSTLQTKALEIEMTDLPDCMMKNEDKAVRHRSHRLIKVKILLVLFSLMIILISCQHRENVWVTELLRVQFQDSADLEDYNGCYEMMNFPSHGRRTYHSNSHNQKKSSFGYCRDTLQWILFKDDGDEDFDPCIAKTYDRELAHSSKTTSFDIGTTFEESWVSSAGSPLEMYFFDTEDKEYNCNLTLGDGECDLEFNKLGYQYDGGDCCAHTCLGSLCGKGGLQTTFGKNISGDGFPHCESRDTVRISIHINNVTSSRDPELLAFENRSSWDYWIFYHNDENIILEDDWREQTPQNPYFSLDCNGKNVLTTYIEKDMTGQNEVVQVEDGADCTLVVRNNNHENYNGKVQIDSVIDVDPIWLINYTIFYEHEVDSKIEILSQHSMHKEMEKFKIIPRCYFEKLENHIDFASIYQGVGTSNRAIDWLIDDDGGNSECQDEQFIERYAITQIFFAMNVSDELHDGEKQCTWPSITCSKGSVETLKLSGKIEIIANIPSEISLLTKLETLILSSNNIKEITFAVDSLPNLNTLILSENQLTTMQGIIISKIGNWTSLQTLDLNENQITTIPTEIGDLTSLRELYLRDNQITTIPTEIGDLTNLQILKFHENQIITIPTEIGNLTSLQELFFNYNQITTIPAEIGDLTNLQTLSFRNNSIKTIPAEIGNLKKLQKLGLYENQLTTIPTMIGNLTSIQKLYLRYNQFTTIPTIIGDLTSLQELYLHYNRIKTIPTEIGDLTNLQILKFHDNQIKTIPAIIGNLTSLQKLYLHKNQIATIPTIIGNLTNLQTLSLGYNPIKTIPTEIGYLTSLQNLYLCGNENISIPHDIADNLTSLNTNCTEQF